MRIDLTNEEIKTLKSILEKIESPNGGWIFHDGKGEPEVPDGMIVEMEYPDGMTEKGIPSDYIGWDWSEEANHEDLVIRYRFIEDTRGDG